MIVKNLVGWFLGGRRSRTIARPNTRVRLSMEQLEDRVTPSAGPYSWLGTPGAGGVPKSGYPISQLYGTNPSTLELQSKMQELATQYNVPIEIVAADCYQESTCLQYDADGFIIRNQLEDKAAFMYPTPVYDSKGNKVPVLHPPGIGLMQLTDGTATALATQYGVDVTQFIAQWQLNLSAGVRHLSQLYDSSIKNDPAWMKALDIQNRNILENWFYAIELNNPGDPTYAHKIFNWIANPKPPISGLYTPVTVTEPQSIFGSKWTIWKTSFVATASGVWYMGDQTSIQGGPTSVHASTGTGANVTPAAPTGDVAWQNTSTMPQSLATSAAAVLNAKIYVMGWTGAIDANGYAVNTTSSYDPSSNAWSTRAAVAAPWAPANGEAAAVNSKIYVVLWGQVDQAMGIYDPASNTWNIGATLPETVRDAAVVAVGGKVYVIGGQDSSQGALRGSVVATVQVYDPATNSWATRNPMPTARAAAAAATLDGLVYVFGGAASSGTASWTATETYNPSTDSWTTKPPMPTWRDLAGVGVSGGKIYLFGGWTGGDYLSSVDEFDPTAGTWRTLSSRLPTARSAAVSAVVNDKFYMIGGQISTGVGAGTVASNIVVQGSPRYLATCTLGSIDPNNLTGPASYITSNQSLPYTIDFENEAAATLPAQKVVITDQLDPALDWTTFVVRTFTIGGTTYNAPANLGAFSTRLDLTASLGIFLDVAAGIDLNTGIVTWTFTSIDPATGSLPANIFMGFLPPNQTSPQGEGSVTYTIQPKATDPVGTVINAQASIVFDSNAAVPTPVVTNTIVAAGTTFTSISSSSPLVNGIPQSTYGLPVTFTAMVTAALGGLPDSGTTPFANAVSGVPLTFYIHSNNTFWNGFLPVFGTVTRINNGSDTVTYSITTSLLPEYLTGAYQVQAYFVGNAKYLATPAPQITLQPDAVLFQKVAPAVTTAAMVSVSPTPSSFGQAVTFTATATAQSGGTPAITNGYMRFYVDGVQVGLGKLALTTATTSTYTFTTSALSVNVGSGHLITAQYVTDNANFAWSAISSSLNQVVNPAQTVTALVSAPIAWSSSSATTLTANVSYAAGWAGSLITGGQVQFFLDDSLTPFATATTATPFATYVAFSIKVPAGFLSAGSHTIKAVFSSTNPKIGGSSVSQTQSVT